MINFIIGLIIGFIFGACAGIIATCFTTVAKKNDEQVKEYERSIKNE